MSRRANLAVINRRIEPPDALDDFPTPPWAARALAHYAAPIKGKAVWEPAVNRGFLARGLADYATVFGTDIHDYGAGYPLLDFLAGDLLGTLTAQSPHWIVTNPPFNKALEFVLRALPLATEGVAILARSNWAEGETRYRELFRRTPPSTIAQFVERVPMVKGRCDPEASTMTSYAWFVWAAIRWDTKFLWIPPCRKRLERPGDYVDPTAPATGPLL